MDRAGATGRGRMLPRSAGPSPLSAGRSAHFLPQHPGSTAPTVWNPKPARYGEARPLVPALAALLFAGGQMSSRVNWSQVSSRNRMRRQGVEDRRGSLPPVLEQPPKQRPQKLSKAELREQAEAAFRAWWDSQHPISNAEDEK